MNQVCFFSIVFLEKNMWFVRTGHFLDYLVLPLTILNLLWMCFGLIFPSVASGASWGAALYLATCLIALLFNWVQIGLLAYQVLDEERGISRRRVYLLRVLDTYVATTIGFGTTFAAIQLVDSTQFFAATPAGITTNPWLLSVQFIFLTVLLIGGVGFGPFVPARTGALVIVGLTNITGWYYTLLAGVFITAQAVSSYKKWGNLLSKKNLLQ